jgi:anaerobic magnesium-protoporphyrin IX monomethyl ester cyclase
MKTSLFVPPGGYFAERWSQGHMMPALGIGYIAAVLEEKGVDVEIVPSHVLDLSWNDIYRKVERDKPDVVGITTTTENRFLSFKLAEVAKEAHPETFVVLGGPHLKTTAYDTLSHLPYVDGVVFGEGEETTLELVKALEAKGDLKKVLGLAFRDNGNVVVNAPRMLLKDLNALPMPARHLEPWGKYNFKMEVPGKGLLPAGNIMTSRGCPFTCNFCATPTNWGTRVRGLTPENVIKEIEHLMEYYNAKAIWFYDDTFNYKRDRVEQICDLIVQRKLDIKWYCEFRVDIMTKPLFAKMVEAGLFNVGFGIESASERICKDIITKRASLKQAFDVIDWCNEFGVIASPGFIFSHPTETWEEAQETIRVIEEIKERAEVGASILHIYPGIPLEQRAMEEGKFPKDFSWTVEHDKRVMYLELGQGHAPLYIDKLTLWQISELVVRFIFAHKSMSVAKKIPKVFRSVHSFGDFKRYLILGLTYFKFKLLQFIKNEKNRKHKSKWG